MPDQTETYLPLTPAVFHILLALADGELHGYAIMQEIAAHTRGEMQLGPGTLYGSIKRMLEAGLIEEAPARQDGIAHHEETGPPAERRRYYRHTELGRSALNAEYRRLARAVDVASRKQFLKPSTASSTEGGC